MAIVPIRKTNTAQLEVPTEQAYIPSPPPRVRRVVAQTCPIPVAPSSEAQVPLEQASAPPRPKQRRGHARKDEQGKWQPTGDYQVGFGRPPVTTRFNGKPGPGRPKGSRSQESYMREELEQVRTIRIDGVPKKLKHRQLVAKLMVANALEKKTDKALATAHEHATRLFPEMPTSEPGRSPLGEVGFDEAVLRQFFSRLSLGEPVEGAGDPLADLLRDPLGPEPEDDDEWNEGDWSVPGEETDDE